MKDNSNHFWQLGLIGYPLGHSFSPSLHHAALTAAQLNGKYELFPIPQSRGGEDQIRKIISLLRTSRIDGLNITIPHKQLVMKFVDKLTATAEAVGAVNTLYMNESGDLIGDNTDVPGFVQDVKKVTANQNGRALVLGAGGSARAVVYGLLLTGWDVIVLARKPHQSQELVESFSKIKHVRGTVTHDEMTLAVLSRIMIDIQLLVNTTPLGMYPNNNTCPWPADLPLPGKASVYDLVYNPHETNLIKRARASGLPAISGAGMLIAQAALAFSIWTGLEPPFMVMEKSFPGYLNNSIE